MVTQAVVDACGLVPIGFREILHVQGKSRVEIFLINIKLPNEIVFSGVSVAKGSLGPGADVLIGMDIINEGDFAVTNLDGRTKFSFRVPSQADIDFVRESMDCPQQSS